MSPVGHAFSATAPSRKPRQVERRVVIDHTQPYNLARFAYFTVPEVAEFLSMGRDSVVLRFKEHRQGQVMYWPPTCLRRGRHRTNKRFSIPYDTLVAFIKRYQGGN